MPYKKFWMLSTLFALLIFLAACADQNPVHVSEYNENDDVYIVFQGEVIEDATSVLPAAMVGELAFDLQEGTHENIKSRTDAEVDHYYIWVCLADACIPVDPFHFSS